MHFTQQVRIHVIENHRKTLEIIRTCEGPVMLRHLVYSHMPTVLLPFGFWQFCASKVKRENGSAFGLIGCKGPCEYVTFEFSWVTRGPKTLLLTEIHLPGATSASLVIPYHSWSGVIDILAAQ